MSYKSYMTYKSHTGGYENLIVYTIATAIYDLTVVFCDQYIDKRSRTHDQMVQAARSGKQNIVEGSLENSIESNLKLTGVARASYGELIEDYKDYLRIKNLSLWSKEDTRIISIRTILDNTYKSYKTNKTYMSYTHIPEDYCNLVITLCYKQSFLLYRLLQAIENKFIKEGGIRENLLKKRLQFKKWER